jgi:hypothetical protein
MKMRPCLLIDVRISGLDASILLFPSLSIDVRISGVWVSTEKNLGEKKSSCLLIDVRISGYGCPLGGLKSSCPLIDVFTSPGTRLQGRKESTSFLSTPFGYKGRLVNPEPSYRQVCYSGSTGLDEG